MFPDVVSAGILTYSSQVLNMVKKIDEIVTEYRK
jgi:hypothetical protein